MEDLERVVELTGVLCDASVRSECGSELDVEVRVIPASVRIGEAWFVGMAGAKVRMTVEVLRPEVRDG